MMRMPSDLPGITDLLERISDAVRAFMDEQGISYAVPDFEAVERQIGPWDATREWVTHAAAQVAVRAITDTAYRRAAVRIAVDHAVDGPGLHYIVSHHRGVWVVFRDYDGPPWRLEGERERMEDWLLGYLADADAIDLDAGPRLDD